MSTPDENKAKTDTDPLLDAAREPAERGGQPRPAGQAALEDALEQSGRRPEDLTTGSDDTGETD
ncbi:hypothetical protein [Nonomuraea sp. NPDC050783]|uniref:hypothetical protein n=1 Tax=Nonomuraea sp. NPDC050783 TaxID=3154634 RepID=UPI0034666775